MVNFISISFYLCFNNKNNFGQSHYVNVTRLVLVLVFAVETIELFIGIILLSLGTTDGRVGILDVFENIQVANFKATHSMKGKKKKGVSNKRRQSNSSGF